MGEVNWLEAEPAVPVPPRHARLAELLQSVLPQLGEVYTGIEMHLDDAAWVGHRLAEILPLPLADKQSYLELDDPLERLDRLALLTPVGAPAAIGHPEARVTKGAIAMAAAQGSNQ